MYRLEFKNVVYKDAKKIPKNIWRKFYAKIKELRLNPYPSNSKKLKGHKDLYRLRYGKYRAIYRVDNDEVVILVLKVGHRKDIYKQMVVVV